MVKRIYVYMILFVTLMMIIGGSVSAFMAMADIVSPSVYRQPFEEYVRWQSETEFRESKENGSVQNMEELRERYEAMIQDEKRNSRSWAYNNLIKSFGWIIIPLPVFLIFQRKLKELEEK